MRGWPAGSAWFEVGRGREQVPEQPENQSSAVRATKELAESMSKRVLGVVEEYRDEDGPNPWLGRTGWAAHFASHTKDY
ncbi:hypothetical protein BM221_007261 [Beauveria bassiana]|uniref:Uncharacterized protein n=1 Tax=Beauveria bassiana TaxID=176275 RepID=A0A2N6NJX9_BEABA|nr:hypothetical protein BM221_010869 [Beauveria bassiana]PMB63329.1 hypothetical protein BM221_010858 [Beauveria bassiana]PMB65127.1 hypothetical protein BM221_008483 [Beauveria bassiana]PMB67580.1 hypothetical protein BM221_007250 [Beauveria bassiana]PMB67591.1 hypothetical protein BM221_007261 [Beauveria bassiana]